MKIELEKMLQANIIRPSRSAWGAPAFFVPKKGGGLRMCINYKPLNKLIRKFHFPISKIDDIIQRLSNFFTVRHEGRLLAVLNGRKFNKIYCSHDTFGKL